MPEVLHEARGLTLDCLGPYLDPAWLLIEDGLSSPQYTRSSHCSPKGTAM